MKVTRVKIHDYLGMIIDFTQEGALKIDMKYYTKGVVEEFPYKIKSTQNTPWTEELLKIQEDAKNIDKEWRSIFQTYVMKAMCFCMRALPNRYQEIEFLVGGPAQSLRLLKTQRHAYLSSGIVHLGDYKLL